MHPKTNNISPTIISIIDLFNFKVFKYIIIKVDKVKAFTITINKIGCFLIIYVINLDKTNTPIIIPIIKGIKISKLLKGFDNISKINSYFFKTIKIAVPLIPGIIVDIASIIPRIILLKKETFIFILIDIIFIKIGKIIKKININILGILLFLNSLKEKSIEPIIKLKNNTY